jgi:stage III sporulation protein AD
LEGEGWPILLKALGVAFLTETAASVCRDSGETGLATWVEIAGKLEILLLSFPLIRTVMDTVTDMLGMA